MKMTIEQLRAWANTATFTAADHLDGETEMEIPAGGYTDDGDLIMKDVICACAWRTLTATLPDGRPFEVTYQEEIQWDTGRAGRINDEYQKSAMTNADSWIMEGVTLIDEDGDDEPGRVVESTLNDVFGSESAHDATAIDYEKLLPAVATEDIDLDEESDMETITVQRDNDTDLRFTGEEVASVSSRDAYSSNNGRWTVLKLWKTKGGKFVCQSIGRTQWQGESDRYSAAVAENEAGIIEFFKHGRLAKELYSEAGIDDVQEIE